MRRRKDARSLLVHSRIRDLTVRCLTIAQRMRLAIRRAGVYRAPDIAEPYADSGAQSLPQRGLGKSGINGSAIGLGIMSFSVTDGPSEDAAASTLIHDAIEAGIT